MFDRLGDIIDERFLRLVGFFRDMIPDALIWAVTQPFQTYAAIALAALWGLLVGKFGALTGSLAILAIVLLAVLV